MTQKSKNHHWWPVGLQTYWADKRGNVSWVEPSGKTAQKNPNNKRTGNKFHGHTIFRGYTWEHNFESEFEIDNDVHALLGTLNQLTPLGRKPAELFALVKLVFKKDRKLRDQCKFYQLDEQLHRNLLLLILSLLIRSPANRHEYESAPKLFDLPANEEVGKMNMLQNYRIAKELCHSGTISNQYFVLLHSTLKKFNFGDGHLDWLTNALNFNRIYGRTLIPLTPNLCVYFSTPSAMRSSPNCAALYAAPWMVDWVNEITQIYSKEKLFFRGKKPHLTQAFQQGEFLALGKRTDALIDMLDEIVEGQDNTKLRELEALLEKFK